MAYIEEKRKRSWRYLRIMEFLSYLCPRSSVLSRGTHCMSWWSANRQKITSKTVFPENWTYPPIWPDSSNLIQTCLGYLFSSAYPGLSLSSAGSHSLPRLSPSQTYPAWELSYSNQTRTYSVPGPNMSDLWVMTRVKSQHRTCLVPRLDSSKPLWICLATSPDMSGSLTLQRTDSFWGL
jgi:hypothetical protein